MTAIGAVLYREMKIRSTNVTFIFWDLFYPLAYLLVFGVGMSHAMGGTLPSGIDYNSFFLGGVLGMASLAIASNTAWSFFMDRDNGIFYEMLTYPMSRSEYLIGKVVFNTFVALAQAALTVALSAVVLGVPVRWDLLPLLIPAVVVGTAGWFFFYALFALFIKRNDAFNSVTSIFYFMFLLGSSMFYPIEPLPSLFRTIASLNPITWHVDAMRFATVGAAASGNLALEAAGFCAFAAASFGTALWALHKQE